MSKISGKGGKRLYLFVTFVTVLITIFAFFPFLFSPIVYLHQWDETPNGCISAAQAYRIAIPHITTYARENNRVILGINIRFWNSSRDLAGQRGDNSLFYPEWEVSAGFLTDPFDPWPIFGYSVLVWADTGEIRGESAGGVL